MTALKTPYIPQHAQRLQLELSDYVAMLTSTQVDAAVEMLQEGKAEEAVSLLKEGIAAFEPNFPDSPEIGELHNQVELSITMHV